MEREKGRLDMKDSTREREHDLERYEMKTLLIPGQGRAGVDGAHAAQGHMKHEQRNE